MSEADEIWISISTNRWICSLIKNRGGGRRTVTFYTLTASLLKRIFHYLRPLDLSSIYPSDESITLKWVMKKG